MAQAQRQGPVLGKEVMPVVSAYVSVYQMGGTYTVQVFGSKPQASGGGANNSRLRLEAWDSDLKI